MLPEPPPLVQCHACGSCYWLGEAKELGRASGEHFQAPEGQRQWDTAPRAVPPGEHEIYAALEQGLAKTDYDGGWRECWRGVGEMNPGGAMSTCPPKR